MRFQHRFVVFRHAPRFGGQRHRRQVGRALAAVGARQEQHVVDQGLQVFQFFQVGFQRVAQLARLARRGQHDLRAVDERGQRRAQLVRHVGVETFHLLVGLLQPFQGAVEGAHQLVQFAVGVFQRQAARQVVGLDAGRLFGQPARRRHAAAHGPGRQHHGGAHPQRADQHQRGAVGVQELRAGARADGHGQLRAGQDAVVDVHAQAAHASAIRGLQHHLPVGPRLQRLRRGAAIDHLAAGLHDPDAQLALARAHFVEGGGQVGQAAGAVLHVDQMVDQLQLAADFGDLLAFDFALERPEQRGAGQAGDQQRDGAQQQRQARLHRAHAQRPHAWRDSST